jgi:hypothetical protein
MILFSDLHRGTGDRADDFRPCRKIYHAALGFYASLNTDSSSSAILRNSGSGSSSGS